jgi:hypothetical protein
MPDVLEIEVDGEPIEDAGRSPGGAPRWGLPAAIAVAGVLAIATVAVVALPDLGTKPDGRPATDAAEAVQDTSSATTEAGVDERVAAAEAALAAWGRFAVTGDTAGLGGTFDVTGPQFQDLAHEAGTISAAPPGPPAYDVTLTVPAVADVSEDEAVVTGTVVWSRPGEVDQRHRWDVVLRRGTAGRWLLWTVRSSS